MNTNSQIVNLLSLRGHVSQHLPENARLALLSAGKDMAAINAAHRFARTMHPQHFNMEDDSCAVKEPRACATFC